MRLSSLFITLLITLNLTGCTFAETAGDKVEGVLSEIGEAYDNIIEKFSSTKELVEEKVDQAQQAAEDIQEAADSVNEAVDSLKDLTGGDDEEPEEATEETETNN
jgi:methyl-accepting chemotaxis protein